MSSNPNWKGGLSKVRTAEELLTLDQSTQRAVKTRIFLSMKRDDVTGCWNWTKNTFKRSGRARLLVGAGLLASKASYVLYRGNTNGLCVLHKCDNVLCVNPYHLFLGTNQDNSDDMVSKGRQASGNKNGSRLHPEKLARGKDNFVHNHPEIVQAERNPRAQLTNEQVKEIRRAYRPYINCRKPSNQRELAKLYGVKTQLITLIVKGRTWTSVG